MSCFDLVIFDCDGVLVDSERLAVRTEAEILSGLGWPLTESDIVVRYQKRAHNPLLIAAGYDTTETRIPWLGRKRLQLVFG